MRPQIGLWVAEALSSDTDESYKISGETPLSYGTQKRLDHRHVPFIGAYKKLKALHCYCTITSMFFSVVVSGCLGVAINLLLVILIPKRYNMEFTNKLRSFDHIRLSLWLKIIKNSLTTSALSQWKEGHEQSILSTSYLTSSESAGPTMGTSHSRSPTCCQNSRCLVNLSSLLSLLQTLAHS